MKVRMLKDEQAKAELLRLLRGCRRFDAAVAWAGDNAIVDAMQGQGVSRRLRNVVIGTHMYQTDPKVLRAFMKYEGVRCLPPDGRLFHPKVYFFEMPNGVAAIVGSHNMTKAAFSGKNIEVSVLMEGSANDNVFADLRSFIESSWGGAECIDEANFLFAYEVQHAKAKEKRESLSVFRRLKKSRDPRLPSPMDFDWRTFVERVKGDRHHAFDHRLEILERAATLFAEGRSFAGMGRLERKAIAGTYHRGEKTLDNLEWGWFGSMSGLGVFVHLVNDAPRGISSALGCIPPNGDVSEGQYEEFIRKYSDAFRRRTHQGRVGTGTRLLALKRPDFFVGVNKQNREGICHALATAPTTLNLDSYWERIIIPVQNSPWWLASRPKRILDGRIWDNRCALLDSIYYVP